MRLALDEPTHNDCVEEVEELRLIIDKDLAALTDNITIDKTFWGITVASQMDPAGMHGSCAI